MAGGLRLGVGFGETDDRPHGAVPQFDDLERRPDRGSTSQTDLPDGRVAGGNGFGSDLPQRRVVGAVEESGGGRVGEDERVVERHHRV